MGRNRSARKAFLKVAHGLMVTYSLAGLTPTALSMSFPLAFSKMKCDRFVLPRPTRPLNTRQSQ